MHFKKFILIFVLLFSSTWAVNSNEDPRYDDDPRNDEQINPVKVMMVNSKFLELIIYRI